MHDNFDHEKLEAISDMLLDPKNVLIMLRAKCLETDQTEKWYGTKYKVENISESLMKKIANPNIEFSNKKLDLPPANTLLPSGIEIVSESTDKVPHLSTSSDSLDLWVKRTNSPQSMVALQVLTPSLPSAMFQQLWCSVLSEYMSELNYMAYSANLTFEVKPSHNGMEFYWVGFTSSMHQYVK